MAVMQSLWGGELPEFQGLEEAQALIDTLLTGLWNRLSVHQDLSRPFRLTAIDSPVDSGAINRYASIRKEELEAFVNGLFGDNEAMVLTHFRGRISSFRSGHLLVQMPTLEVDRRDPVQGRMAPMGVIPTLDPLEHG